MEEIIYRTQKGYFIPKEEFENGKFFNKDEIFELRVKIRAQYELIKEITEQV